MPVARAPHGQSPRPLEHMVEVPGECVAARLGRGARWDVLESLSVVRVVSPSVVPVGAQAIADADFIVRRDADVALIEEGVELFGEEEAVLDMVAARSEVRLDVRCVEDGTRVLTGYRAAAIVSSEEAKTESALAFTFDELPKCERAVIDLEGLEAFRQITRNRGSVFEHGRT